MHPRSSLCLLSPISCLLFTLLIAHAPAFAQERQVPFDTKGTILEIRGNSPYAPIWTPETGPFDRLLAFESDTVVIVEVYRTVDGSSIRTRRTFDRPRFAALQARVDSASNVVMRRGGEMSNEEIEDLRSTFTYDQTGFSTFHATTATVLTEEGSLFWIVTGGSYFLFSAISDNMDVTRANVEAAKYGHLTGILQGLTAAAMLEAEDKGAMALGSLGGIAHAIASYRLTSGSDADPTFQYLRMTAERHSLVWGMGTALALLGEDPSNEAWAGLSLGMSLSSNLWSPYVFGFGNRNMSWGDALIADEFMTPWYLTMLSAVVSFEIEDARPLGWLMSAGGVSGYMLALHLNEGRMRTLGTVKRTRLLLYGGALLGLGITAAVRPESGKTVLWIISGSTWLGYFIGGRFGGEGPASSSSWDVRLMPENLAMGSLLKPAPGRPFVRPLPVATVTFSF